MSEFLDRHAERILGVLSCWDRVVITGTFPEICYAQIMTSYLYRKNIRIFDYTQWAEPLREEIRENAERLAKENGLEIDFIRKKDFRKEERVKEIVAKRGSHPGMVHIFSAMEPCSSFKPWHDKGSGRTFLKYAEAQCLHY